MKQENGIPQSALPVVEISDATLRRDRRKRDLYARAAVPKYWIINLKDNRSAIFRNPSGERENAGSGKSAEEIILQPSKKVSPPAFPDISIEFAQILP